MNTQIIHIVRNGQEIGAWPAFLITKLVKESIISPNDTFWLEGMTEQRLVSDIVDAQQATPPPLPDILQPVAVQSAKVKFSDALNLVFYFGVAGLIVGPFIFLVGFFLYSVVIVGLLGGFAAALK